MASRSGVGISALCRPNEEELRRFAEWGYYASSVEALTGLSLYDEESPFPMRLIQALGAVPDPNFVPPWFRSFPAIVLLVGAAAMRATGVAYSWHKRQRKMKL